MSTNVDNTIISLVILIVLIIYSLTRLVLQTLREGSKALKELNKD